MFEIRLASWDICEKGDRWRAYLNLQYDKELYIKPFTFSHIGYSLKDKIRHRDRRKEGLRGGDLEIHHNWEKGTFTKLTYLEHCKLDRV